MKSIAEIFGRKVRWAEHWARVFRVTFRSITGQQVLLDLADYCFANASTYDADEKRFYMNEGRREVWLHIQELTNLMPEELVALYERRGFPAAEGEE